MTTQEFASLPKDRRSAKVRDTLAAVLVALVGGAIAYGGVHMGEKLVVFVGAGLALLGATVADREAVVAALGALTGALKGVLGATKT